MKTPYAVTKSLTLEISKELASSFAPEEIDLFDEIAAVYFVKSDDLQLNDKRPDSLLGFGTGETIIALTPAILAAVDTVLNYIGLEIIKIGKDETVDMLKGKLKNLFVDSEKKNAIEPLSHTQLELIKSLAQKKASEFGMKPKKAKHLAEALVGVIALKTDK